MRIRSLIRVGPSKTECLLSPDMEATFAPMEAIREAGLDRSQTRLIGELAAGSYNYFAEGDILLAKVTPCFENGNKVVASNLVNGVGFATSEVHVVRPDARKLEARYLNYVFSTAPFVAQGVASMTGAGGLRRVSEAAVRNFDIEVPALEVQQRVADELDAVTGDIDRMIASKRDLLDLLREKQSAELDFSTFRAGDTATWTRIPFRWICRVQSGQVDPREEPWRDLPLIAPNHIESATGRLLATETAAEQGAESGKYAFAAGTVLYSKIRPALAKACIAPVDGLCSADMYPIVPDKRLRPTFLLMQLLSRTFTEWSTLASMRVAMPKINRETLGDFALVVPPIEQQERLARRWLERKVLFEGLIDATTTSLALLRERRTALITDVISSVCEPAQHRLVSQELAA